MKTQRDITLEQLRYYTEQAEMSLTEQGGQRKRAHGSVQTALEQTYGDHAIGVAALKRIYSARSGETREPSMTELYQLATVLNVPTIALLLDMRQPYAPSPLSDGRLTMLDVFLDQLDPWRVLTDLPTADVRFINMTTAARIYRLEAALEGYARNSRKAVELHMHALALDAFNELTALALTLLADQELHCPSAEIERLTSVTEDARTVFDIASSEAPLYTSMMASALDVMSRDVVLAPARNDTVPIQEVSVQTACH